MRRTLIASLLLASLPLLLAASQVPGPVSAADRAAAVAEASKLVDEMEAKGATMDAVDRIVSASKARMTLMPAIRDPGIHDPKAAIVLARIALVTQDFSDIMPAMAMLEDCQTDAKDATVDDLAPKIKKILTTELYSLTRKERAELRDNLVKARAGDMNAADLVGDAYAGGHGLPSDHEEAARFYRVSAEAGNANAMASMAIYEKVDSKCLEWLEKSFAAGNDLAAARIAEYYAGTALGFRNTHDIPKDFDKALAWFRVSFHAGYTTSANSIGKLYENKAFSAADPAIALGYWRVAAASYHSDAVNALKAQGRGQLDLGFTFDAPKVKTQLGKEPPATTAVVDFVYPGTPAAESGLAKGDVITEVNGKTFGSILEFKRLAFTPATGKNTFTFTRAGKSLTVTFTAPEKIAK